MQQLEARPQPQNRTGGLSANVLKIIAILAMVIDHSAYVILPSQTSWLAIAMHFVGRITGPVMFYLLAEGYRHTRNISRYTWRLALFALISWPVFYSFRTGAFPGFGLGVEGIAPFGIIYTLLLALLAIRARHEIKNMVLKVAAIAVLIVLSFYGDWAIYGVVLPLLFDIFYGNFKKQALAAGIVILISFVPDALVLLAQGRPVTLANYYFVPIQIGQFLPLALLAFYNGRRGRGGAVMKWLFYIFYPLHLAVLGVLRWGWPW